MLALTILLIVLQAADGLSTHMALSTGMAEEKNALLVSIAALLGWSVAMTVLAAKFVTAALFAWGMVKTKANWWTVAALALLACYVTYIVTMNFYWAWLFR